MDLASYLSAVETNVVCALIMLFLQERDNGIILCTPIFFIWHCLSLLIMFAPTDSHAACFNSRHHMEVAIEMTFIIARILPCIFWFIAVALMERITFAMIFIVACLAATVLLRLGRFCYLIYLGFSTEPNTNVVYHTDSDLFD